MTLNSGVQLSFRLDCTAEQPASFYDTLVLFGALGIFVLFKGTIWHVVYFTSYILSRRLLPKGGLSVF